MNEVKVYDGNGKLKEIISEKQVVDMMWKSLEWLVNPSKTSISRKPKPLPERGCNRCKILYVPSRANNDFCSRKCQKQHYRDERAVPEITLKCRRCEKEFLGTKSRKYCNDPCSYYVLADGSHRWRQYNV